MGTSCLQADREIQGVSRKNLHMVYSDSEKDTTGDLEVYVEAECSRRVYIVYGTYLVPGPLLALPIGARLDVFSPEI